MHFLFLMNLPSVSNFNSPLKIAGLKNQKPFCRDQSLSYFHSCLIQSFSTDLILLGFFLKKSHHILSSFPVYLY